ncbi:MAG: hypothetical protein J7497_06700, partial [Chitinophagaceae bacterium]|nr:hypothetical protein [Chitinophagaceae bacterium]
NTSCAGFNTQSDRTKVTTDAGEYVVSRIDGTNGYVLLNSTADRTDNGTGRKINTINIYDSTGSLKKRYKFNYGYFNDWSPYAIDKRLKLLNFSELGITGTDSLVYKFEYEESVNLPSTISTSVDYWGFYNGYTNSSHFPNLYYSDGLTTIRRVDYANRSANPDYGKANILTKIIYPTGGYREFIYEGNTALVSTFSHQYPEPDYLTNQSFTRTDFLNVISPSRAMTQYFSVNSTNGGAVFKYTLGVGGGCGSGYSVKLYKVPVAEDDFGGTLIYNYSASTFTTDLLNGNYRMEIYKTSTGCSFSSLNGSWHESTLNTATITTPNGTFPRNNRKVGGVRIKELRDYDPVTNKTNTTQYLYKLYSTDSAYTSGLLISTVRVVSTENFGADVGCDYYKLLSTSAYPLASEGGSYVVYPEVRTIESGNGRTDRIYNFMSDDVPSGFPAEPPGDNSHNRGQLLSERIYDQSGTLIRKTINTYTNALSQSQASIRVKPYFMAGWPTDWQEGPYTVNDVPDKAACNTWYLMSHPWTLASTTDSLFSPSGTIVSKTENIFATYNGGLLPSKIKTYVNNGAIKESSFKYVFTTNSAFTFGLTTPEQTMKTTLSGKNYLLPLEIVDSLKPASGAATLTGGIKTIFGTYNTDNIHPSKMQLYSTLTDDKEINLSAYDVKGNLTEKYETNSAKEVYLWGYKGAYPVAKVIGSDYATVAGLVDMSVVNNPSTEAVLRAELNNIRTGLAGTAAQVYTYTYTPLVGMTSATDPSGKSTYYSYDLFGRLILVKDEDFNIIKKYCYDYQGLPVNCN